VNEEDTMNREEAVTTTEKHDVERSKRGDGAQRVADIPALMPPVDVIEDSTGITLYADLPGVSKDKLELSVEGDMLSIEGEVGIEMPQSMQASYAEVNSARYRRMFTLSKELDPSKISAELAQGVLKLRIPKAEHAQPRRIQVNA
jgi:HSP20 family molecular chaperone IbpA